MISEASRKVRSSHLKRDAYLYVRQSTIRQVFENTESTKRQYALRERAMGLGWPLERIVDAGQIIIIWANPAHRLWIGKDFNGW